MKTLILTIILAVIYVGIALLFSLIGGEFLPALVYIILGNVCYSTSKSFLGKS